MTSIALRIMRRNPEKHAKRLAEAEELLAKIERFEPEAKRIEEIERTQNAFDGVSMMQ